MYYCCLNITSRCCVVCMPCYASFAVIKTLTNLVWLKTTLRGISRHTTLTLSERRWCTENVPPPISESLPRLIKHHQHYELLSPKENAISMLALQGLLQESHILFVRVFPTHWSLSSTQKESRKGKFAAMLSKSSWDMYPSWSWS